MTPANGHGRRRACPLTWPALRVPSHVVGAARALSRALGSSSALTRDCNLPSATVSQGAPPREIALSDAPPHCHDAPRGAAAEPACWDVVRLSTPADAAGNAALRLAVTNRLAVAAEPAL